MLEGEELEEQVYEPEHIEQVLAEIEANFPRYFKSFAGQPLKPVFDEHIRAHDKEQKVYREYLDLDALDEFESAASAFKAHTRTNCPIIRRCLNAADEVMQAYRVSFGHVTGRELLNTVHSLARFGVAYVAEFDDEEHEAAVAAEDLDLESLDEAENLCPGVIGYGIQSSLLYGLYPRNFAHRSQNAVWSLYFISGRKKFGLIDDSEFLMVRAEAGTCEQNYSYPAEMFGFYALKMYGLLKSACQQKGVTLYDHCRYIYLSAFCDHIAEVHQENINTLKWSSEHVENRPWF